MQTDRAALRALLDSDQRAAGALGRADALAARGKGADAAQLVRRDAAPIANAGAAQAAAAALRSAWGKQRGAEIRALLADRQTSLGGYAAALESDDLAAVVASLEQQKALEARGLALSQALDAAPDGSGCR